MSGQGSKSELYNLSKKQHRAAKRSKYASLEPAARAAVHKDECNGGENERDQRGRYRSAPTQRGCYRSEPAQRSRYRSAPTLLSMPHATTVAVTFVSQAWVKKLDVRGFK